MQIVIDIDENLYTRLFDNGTDFYDTDDILAMAKAIRKGTPLPKGHDRLIEANSVDKIVKPIAPSDAEWGVTAETAIMLIHDAFDKAPTIIEADKESEDEE